MCFALCVRPSVCVSARAWFRPSSVTCFSAAMWLSGGAAHLRPASGSLGPQDDLEAKWKRVMFQHASSMKLWQAYLQHTTSHLARFRMPRCMAQFHKGLETLAGIRRGTFASHRAQGADLDQSMLAMFVDSCAFQSAAGFQERSLACFQALVEYNMFSPQEFKGSAAGGRSFTLFEAFWESSAPRVGDENAAGFAEWVSRRQLAPGQAPAAGPVSFSRQDAEEPLPEGLTLWQQWLQTEGWREAAHFRPWRANLGEAEEACEDPDRIVMFDDIVRPGAAPFRGLPSSSPHTHSLPGLCLFPPRRAQSSHLFRLNSPPLQVELVFAMAEALGVHGRARHSTRHPRTQGRALRQTCCGTQFGPLHAAVTSVHASE